MALAFSSELDKSQIEDIKSSKPDRPYDVLGIGENEFLEGYMKARDITSLSANEVINSASDNSSGTSMNLAYQGSAAENLRNKVPMQKVKYDKFDPTKTRDGFDVGAHYLFYDLNKTYGEKVDFTVDVDGKFYHYGSMERLLPEDLVKKIKANQNDRRYVRKSDR